MNRVVSLRLLALLPRMIPFSSLAFFIHSPATAITLPPRFSSSAVSQPVFEGTAMEFAPDGRLFVCEQAGAVRVIRNGQLLAQPFATFTPDHSGERGLLGIAFDPGFATNQFVYVHYTATDPVRHNRVSRITANGDVAVPGSEVAILDLDPLSSALNHNGGAIHFGTDGMLYVGVGENGTPANAQNLDNRLGKILRIRPDGSIPADNPFNNTATGANKAIWALGLRNPFTFAVQPGSGRLFINNVGEGAWESIFAGARGANYGWPLCEAGCTPADPRLTPPVFRYPHGGGSSSGNCIAGGTFYNPETLRFPATFFGLYFFADFVNGWIRTLDPARGNAVSDFASGISGPLDLKVGPDGRLYCLERNTGNVLAISYQPPAPPAPSRVSNPAPITLANGAPASPFPSTLNVAGSSGGISQLSLTLSNVTHPWPADLDILLVGPHGQRALVWSDAGGANPVSAVTVTLSDAASGPLPATAPILSGSYQPTDLDPASDALPAPAPAGPYGSSLGAFRGQEVNGTWALFVNSDHAGGSGTISGGWSLTFQLEQLPRITSVRLDGRGGIQLTTVGEPGRSYSLDTSSDLLAWTQRAVKTNFSGDVIFLEPALDPDARFHRIRLVP